MEWATSNGVASDALVAVLSLAELLWQRGALDEAAELLGAARPLEAARPAERGRRTVDMLLGMVALARGDLVAAHDHLVVALRSRMAYGFRSRACDSLNAMAVRCAHGGDPKIAARLFGAAQATRTTQRGAGGLFAAYWSQEQDATRAVLGDHAFDAAYASGAELTLEQAAAMALAVEHPDLAAGSSRFAAEPETAGAPDAGQLPRHAVGPHRTVDSRHRAEPARDGDETTVSFRDPRGDAQPPHPRRSRTYRGALIGDGEADRRRDA
jgi:hypothetical protein